jgi:hypothetical protein
MYVPFHFTVDHFIPAELINLLGDVDKLQLIDERLLRLCDRVAFWIGEKYDPTSITISKGFVVYPGIGKITQHNLGRAAHISVAAFDALDMPSRLEKYSELRSILLCDPEFKWAVFEIASIANPGGVPYIHVDVRNNNMLTNMAIEDDLCQY